jgi:uncharacterized membrane protein YhaH (DUF805 family)
MTLRRLLFSHKGRINRARWWAAILALSFVSTACAAVINGFTAIPRRDLIVTLILLNLWLAPAYAVSAKRFQDRNKRGVTALYGLVPQLIARLLEIYSITYNETLPTTFGAVCDLVQLVVSIWFAIELGMLKGSSGPNRFGPDPLAPNAPDDVFKETNIGNSPFAYTVSLGGAVVMVMICNGLVCYFRCRLRSP